MRALLLLALLLALAPTPPHLTATWERPGIARITHGSGCLWRNDTFYRCFERAGVLRLGARGPLDAAYRPRAGDVYRLVRPDGTTERAQLRSVVYLPAFF